MSRPNVGAAAAVSTVVAAAQAQQDSTAQPGAASSITFGDGAEAVYRELVAALADRQIVVRIGGRDYVALGVGTSPRGEGHLDAEAFDDDSGVGTGEVYEIPWSEIDHVHVY